MAATKDSTKRRSGRGSTPRTRQPAAAATPPAAEDRDGTPAEDRRQPTQPPKVKSLEVSARIRAIADRCESIDSRRCLRRLARLIAASPKSVHKISLLEAEIGGCLDRADGAVREPREPWLQLESATWALAWLARSRRAGGSAGSLLEQLVRRGRVATGALAGRDTQPAPFVLTLARLFPDIESCAELGLHAIQAVEEEIARLASESGALRLNGSATVLDRVSRWALCRDVIGGDGWPTATEERFQASVSYALRLLGAKGRMLVGVGRMPGYFSRPLLQAARRGKAGGRLRRTAAVISGEKSAAAAKRLLDRDVHDAATATAVLRSGWDADSLRVLVEYRDAVPRLEIAVGDRLLVDGPWPWSVTADGERLDAEGPWSFSGMESDRKSTFFEFAAPLTGGLRLERTIVVLPSERIVVLADAVTRAAAAAAPRDLRFGSEMRVAPGLETEQAAETREVFLYDTGMRCMVLPLGLGEWQAAGPGHFTASPTGLALEQHGAGRLHAAVWFDCDPRRLGRPVTWRQLTVADTRVNLPRSMAAGYRVQVGHDQWLLYRALDEPRNRTLLGCNVSCEFLLGRVGRSGEVRRLVEIQ